MEFFERFKNNRKGSSTESTHLSAPSKKGIDFKALAKASGDSASVFAQGLQSALDAQGLDSSRELQSPSTFQTFHNEKDSLRQLITEYGSTGSPALYDEIEAKIASFSNTWLDPEKISEVVKEDPLASPSDLTPAERKQILADALKALDPSVAPPAMPSFLSGDDSPNTGELLLVPEVASGDAVTAQRKEGSTRTTKEVAPKEREALQIAEGEYLLAYKDFHAHKKIWNLAEPTELRDLKNSYDDARHSYSTALEESVVQRLMRSKRFQDKNFYKRIQTEDGPRVVWSPEARVIIERYSRLVTYNEVVKPAAELRLQARLEALSSREQSTFSKAIGWVGEQNKKLEAHFGRNGARVVRAVGITTVLAPVAFTGTGAVALAGWASLRVGRSLASAFAGGAIGASVGEWFDTTLGAKFQKMADMRSVELKSYARAMDSTWRGFGREHSLDEVDKLQEKLAKRASDATRQKQKIIVQVLTAFGVGAGTSALISNWESLTHFGNHSNSVEGTTQGKAPEETAKPESEKEVGVRSSIEKVPKLESSEPLIPKAVTSQNEVSQTGADLDMKTQGPATVEVARGEGADRLVNDLQNKLRAMYPDPKHYPENVRVLLNHSPHRTAELLGLGHQTGGVMLHPGDTLSLDEHGRVVFHDNIHDRDRVVIDEKHELQNLKPLHRVPIMNSLQVSERQSVVDTSPNVRNPENIQDVEKKNIQPSKPVQPPPASDTGGIVRLQDLVEKNATSESPSNNYGISIDSNVPHVYVTEKNSIVVYGGAGTAVRTVAEQYARAHPGTDVRFETATPDRLGNPITYTTEIRATESGEIQIHIPNVETQGVLTAPDPKTFIEVKE